MKIKKFALLAVAGLTLSLGTGCDGDDGPGGLLGCTDAASDYLEVYNDYASALSAYSEDPSTENCQRLKTELRDFINAWEDYVDCIDFIPGVDLGDYDADELEDELDDLDC